MKGIYIICNMYDKDKNFYKPERGSSVNPDHIMLSFCGDSRYEMAVTWRTSEEINNGYATLKESGSSDYITIEDTHEFKETDIDRSVYHWVRFTGLKPGTKYFYTVGNDEYRTEEFSFSTQEEELDHFKFIVISDHQKGIPTLSPDYSTVRNLLHKALKDNPDTRFIFTGGDNCDNGQNDLQWNGMFTGLEGIIESIPFMMTTGNHDNRGYITYFPEPTGKYYLNHADFFDFQYKYSFPLNGPEGYETENYSFDYGNVHFLVMGINAPEKVSDWAYNDLQSSDKTWKIGSYHFPIYPVMPEGQNDDAYPWLRKPIEDGRLDVLIAGHEHSFARTFPMKNDEMFDKPSQGVLHYIAGNASGNIYHSNAQKVWHSCFYPQEEIHGLFSVFEVNKNRLTMTAYMDDGRIVDFCIIDKDKDIIFPPALAPVYDSTKLCFKGRMLELSARGCYAENIDGVWYAPIGVVIQAVGGKVEKGPDFVKAYLYKHWSTFYEGNTDAYTDKGTIHMKSAPYFKNGQLYIPVEESSKIYSLDWYYAKRNNIINWNTPDEEWPLYKHPSKE